MQDSGENDVVSSSSPSPSSSSSPQSPESQTCAPPGTPVSLQGKIWMEMDNALVLHVDWRGKNFAGTLIKMDDNNVWAPQRLNDYPSNTKCQKAQKIWKKFNTYGANSRGRGSRQRGMYSRKYPRSFVDSSNIVESKLRYGRDKRVAAYSSCPSSPRSSDSRTDIVNSSDLSSSANSSVLKRSISLSLGKPINTSSKSSTDPQNPDQQNSDEQAKTQCDEVGSSRISDNPAEELECKTSLEDETEDNMPSLSRMDIYAENSRDNCSSNISFLSPERNTSRMPSLIQYKTKISNMNEIYDANTGDGSGQHLIPSCSTDSKSEHAPAAEMEVAAWGLYEDADNAASLPISSDDCDKTYTTLENCDLSYLQLPYPPDTNELSMSSAQFSCSPLLSDDDSKSAYSENQPFNQVPHFGIARQIALQHDTERRPASDVQNFLSVSRILGVSKDEGFDASNSQGNV